MRKYNIMRNERLEISNDRCDKYGSNRIAIVCVSFVLSIRAAHGVSDTLSYCNVCIVF